MKQATKKLISVVSIFAIAVSLLIGCISFAMPTLYNQLIHVEFINDLKRKFSKVETAFNRDRVYLHFDKTFYAPGETIWFGAYVLNSSDMKASVETDILHVDFISPNGSVEKSLHIIAKNGRCAGDFELLDDAPGGLYKVKAWTQWQKNELDTLFFEKEIQVQHVILPALKMKLDFLKKSYGAGDTVHVNLNAFSNENQPLSEHVFNFEIQVGGKKYFHNTVRTDEEGNALISFSLPANLKTTDVLLNAKLEYQGQTESISRSVPVVLNAINIRFFPEGGDMVSGFKNRIAFSASNEFGKAADISGLVLDSKKNVVARFSSFHNGRGTFEFTPLNGESYHVKITEPRDVKTEYKLPEALVKSYVMGVSPQSNNSVAVTVQSPAKTEVSLVMSLRGKLYFAESFSVDAGTNTFDIPVYNMPMGIAQLTLFDGNGVSRAERLLFVNKNRQLNISVETDKENYLPREKVKLTIKAEDENGIPVPGTFSLSVVDDQLLSFADDKSGNIVSQLFLESELKEKVEEPAFYFNRNEKKADMALDHLLMTSGWRRFTWDKILNEEMPNISFQSEKAIAKGLVLDAQRNAPLENVEVKVKNSDFKTYTDKEGKYEIKNLDLSEEKILVFKYGNFQKMEFVVHDYSINNIHYLYHANYYQREDFLIPQAAEGAMMDEMAVVKLPQAMHIKEGMGARTKNKVLADAEKKNIKHEKLGAAKNDKHVAENKNRFAFAEEDLGEIPVRNLKIKNVQQIQDATGKKLYYRSRQFSSPDYSMQQNPEKRTDFRSTLYWNPIIELDKSGKKEIEFYNSDAITSYRLIIEGVGVNGLAGRYEKKYFTQLPFSVQFKFPAVVLSGDYIRVPLTLKNTTSKTVQGNVVLNAPSCLKLQSPITTLHSIPAQSVKVVYMDFMVMNASDSAFLHVAFHSNGLNDSYEHKFVSKHNGFPVALSFSGNEMSKSYCLETKNVVKGSLRAELNVFPSVVSDLLKGIESVLREPSGCFEQTSMSSYPNIMVMEYLKSVDRKDPKLMASASQLIDKGYQKLISFETKEKGYEWFGGAPAHEALSAYGLMQFNDMKNVYANVDQKMIDRTAQWLMSRKDGKGGFLRNERALDNFGGASREITDAYLVYALAEAGYKDIAKEADVAYQNAINSKDPYLLALLTNAMFEMDNKKNALKALELLYKMQEEDGSFMGKTHSITRSTNSSLRIETTSLAVLAMLKSSDLHQSALSKACGFIVSSRSGSGAFGSTQGSILALKALTEFAKYSKQTAESGTIEVIVDGVKVTEKSYKAGEKGPILISGIEKFLTSPKHTVEIAFKGVKNPLPHTLSMNYYTSLPVSQNECKVDLDVKLSAKNTFTGETLGMQILLKNKTNEGLPSTMIILGIPAGLSVQAWQLKEIMDKKWIDYYEIKDTKLFIYYRQMAPEEVKNINLDLKVELPGVFQAEPSCAYLYYTNEFKKWLAIDKVNIKKS